jgi:hypothetical protein
VQLEGVCSFCKKSNDLAEIRSHDHAACSIMPQPTPTNNKDSKIRQVTVSVNTPNLQPSGHTRFIPRVCGTHTSSSPFLVAAVGVRWGRMGCDSVYLIRQPLLALCYLHRMMDDDCGTVDGMRIC